MWIFVTFVELIRVKEEVMIHISDIAIETIELDHLALFLSKNIMIDKKFT